MTEDVAAQAPNAHGPVPDPAPADLCSFFAVCRLAVLILLAVLIHLIVLALALFLVLKPCEGRTLALSLPVLRPSNTIIRSEYSPHRPSSTPFKRLPPVTRAAPVQGAQILGA